MECCCWWDLSRNKPRKNLLNFSQKSSLIDGEATAETDSMDAMWVFFIYRHY